MNEFFVSVEGLLLCIIGLKLYLGCREWTSTDAMKCILACVCWFLCISVVRGPSSVLALTLWKVGEKLSNVHTHMYRHENRKAFNFFRTFSTLKLFESAKMSKATFILNSYHRHRCLCHRISLRWDRHGFRLMYTYINILTCVCCSHFTLN